MTPRVLIVAGSDSGGGAGIQADLRTVTALGGHAMTAITALTAQNTVAVERVMAVPADMVVAQIDAVTGDIGVDAIKIGMLGSAAIAEAIAPRLGGVPVVLDPVMVATSGGVLADADTVAALERLFPRATLLTPNVPELARLTGYDVADEIGLAAAARSLADRHGVAVLAKGGHLAGDMLIDLLVAPDGEHRWADPRLDSRHTHGTGCTLAGAIATGLGTGLTLVDAIDRARRYVRAAIAAAPGLGRGHGPMGWPGTAWDGREAGRS